MDFRAIVNQVNREEDQHSLEELRDIENRKQPYLRESSRLSNLMAGERGKKNQTPENLEAYEKANEAIRKLDRERMEVQNRQNAYQKPPIDPAPYLEQARAMLEEERRVMAWAASQAFEHRSVAHVTDFEQARQNVESLKAVIEACELALEAMNLEEVSA